MGHLRELLHSATAGLLDILSNSPTQAKGGLEWGTVGDYSRQRRVGFSIPHKPCVQTSGDGGVGGAFDDGAAVGEQGHLVGVGKKLQNKIVVADAAVGFQAAAQGGEVYRALSL